MPDTHDIGPLYWHTLQSPGKPKRSAGRAWTEEVEAPFRHGAGWAIRIGRRRFLILGWWRRTGRTEDEALAAALGAKPLYVENNELRVWDGPLAEDDAGRAGDGDGPADSDHADARTGAVRGAEPVPDR